MSFKETFLARVEVIKSSEELTKQFTSTSLKDQKRVFKILNTNIKTLNTYVTYIRDLVFHPEIDNHQKTQVSDLGLFCMQTSHVESQRIYLKNETTPGRGVKE